MVCGRVDEELTAVLLFTAVELFVECEEAVVLFFPLVDGKDVVEDSHVEEVEVLWELVVWLDNNEEVVPEDNREDGDAEGYGTDEGADDEREDSSDN